MRSILIIIIISKKRGITLLIFCCKFLFFSMYNSIIAHKFGSCNKVCLCYIVIEFRFLFPFHFEVKFLLLHYCMNNLFISNTLTTEILISLVFS